MPGFVRYVLAFWLAAMLASCGVKESVDNAVAEIAAFHADLDAQHYDAIWSKAAPDMHNASTREDLEKLLSAVHRKLGAVKDSKQTGWKTNATTNGTFVSVTMQTEFEKGSGVEQFTFRKEDGELALVGYNISSADMMLN